MKTLIDPIPEREFAVGLANFAAVCQEEATVLGLDEGDLAAIAQAATTLSSDLNAVTTARAAFQAAIAAKDEGKASAKALVSAFSRRFRANPSVPDDLLTRLRLAPHQTPPTDRTPTMPTELVATADGDGTIRLRWNRNGNIERTIFVVERREGPEEPWAMAGVTTRRSFRTNSPPGRYVAFRVRAQRRGVTSGASVPVVLWAAGAPSAMEEAA